tara:strand:- start:42 stop:1043 length:1002 start_codon:yes stop_codon:yes gene_type:complete
MTDSIFFDSLKSKEIEKSKKFIQTKLNTEKDLINVISELILFSSLIFRTNNKKTHPLILINSVKNIIGDDRNNPSRILLDFSIEYLNLFNIRTDDEKLIDKTLKEGPRESEFISDLYDVCQEGDFKKIKKISARIFIISEKSRAVLDALVDVLLQNVEDSILFVYHLLRSFQFQKSNNPWVFICSLIQEMKFFPIPNPHRSSIVTPEDIRQSMMLAGEINLFSSVERLWNGDYVRRESYRRELSYWCFKISERKKINNEKNSARFSFKDKKNNFFIKLGESIVLDKSKSLKAKTDGLVILESLRAIKKTSKPDELELLENCFATIIENENWKI